LGVTSASNVASYNREDFGTSFSSPIVANIVGQILEKRIDISTFLVKALLISASKQITNPIFGRFSDDIQGFGKIDKLFAVNSLEWRVCYLMQGEFTSKNKDEFHRYAFLFPQDVDSIEVSVAIGKFRTVLDQERNEYIRLHFIRPGVKPKSILKKGAKIGSRKCNCTYKERISILQGSRGR
jgi:hypothetical protein